MLLATLAALALGPLAHGAPTETPAGTLIVLNKSDATASLIDPTSGETFTQLPTGAGPHEVAVSPDGRLAVVTDYGTSGRPGNTLTVCDLTTSTVRDTLDLELNERPHGIQFLGDSRVLVTIESRARVITVDLETKRVVQSIPTEAAATHMLVASPDGRRVYTANIGSGSVSVLDLEQGRLLKSIPTGAGCEGIDVTPDGKQVWSANREANTVSVIDTGTLEVVAELPCGQFPIRLKFTPDGKRALVSNAVSSEVAVFDVAERRELARIPLELDAVDEAGERLFGEAMAGSATPVGVLLAPDGRRAWIAATHADVVAVLDLERLEVVGGIAAGRQPDGLGWSPLARPEPAPDEGDEG